MTFYSRVMRPWKDLATPRRVDLLIAAGLLVWGLPDVPWWWEYPGHAGSAPDVLGSLALTQHQFRRALHIGRLAERLG